MSELPPPDRQTWVPTQPSFTPPVKETAPRGLWVGLIGAGIAIVGALLSWVSVASVFGELGVNGIEGDGKITTALAAIAGASL